MPVSCAKGKVEILSTEQQFRVFKLFHGLFWNGGGMEEEEACVGWCVFCLCVCFFHVKSTENGLSLIHI